MKLEDLNDNPECEMLIAALVWIMSTKIRGINFKKMHYDEVVDFFWKISGRPDIGKETANEPRDS